MRTKRSHSTDASRTHQRNGSRPRIKQMVIISGIIYLPSLSCITIISVVIPLLSMISTSYSFPAPSSFSGRINGCDGVLRRPSSVRIRPLDPSRTLRPSPSFLSHSYSHTGHNTLCRNSSNSNHNRSGKEDANNNPNRKRVVRRRKKYERKRPKTKSEQELDRLRRSRQETYEQIMKRDGSQKDGGASQGNGGTSTNQLWRFETLFPEPVLDEDTIQRDLYEVAERDARTAAYGKPSTGDTDGKMGKASPNPVGRVMDGIFGPPVLQTDPSLRDNKGFSNNEGSSISNNSPNTSSSTIPTTTSSRFNASNATLAASNSTSTSNSNSTNVKIDRPLTRMVEDKLYGFRRTQSGEYEYSTSLIGDGAVQFRDGVRLGNPLRANADRLTYYARKELSKGRLEEAEELYERAVTIDPRDGRAYLGLSRVAQRRRDFQTAKKWLKAGIDNASNPAQVHPITGNDVYDNGASPFLLQALGCLEEKMGNLAHAESLFLAATKSRPSHAAAWISLAQLRTRKLRQGPDAGRFCYRTAEQELRSAGQPDSSHVYTAWAALEWKAGDVRTARKLFRAALKIDPKCSAAWLQMGVMEAERENWEKAKECFETVLKFDQRNTRVLQAYAIMESKRPEGNSREVIGLFERALKANPRDGGVLQAYALYVVKLGDTSAARELLRKGTNINKRHAPIWQAWGVLETRHGKPEDARDVFQQGIWACAQPSGGQSGGRHCTRLWQAWGVLESQEGDHAAARRCFSRALDADSRNVATVTAWTLMEKNLGNYKDARLIFERALKQFSTPTDEKLVLWQAYESMESEAGNLQKAQSVYQRSIGDAIAVRDDYVTYRSSKTSNSESIGGRKNISDDGNEVEVSRWDIKRSDSTFGESEVWMNDGSIEGKVPPSTMNKKKNT